MNLYNQQYDKNETEAEKEAAGMQKQLAYYTSLSGFNGADGTAQGYYQALQIQPNLSNPAYPAYRNGVTIYQAAGDAPAAYSAATTANPQYGAGGALQFFIPGYQNVLKRCSQYRLKIDTMAHEIDIRDGSMHLASGVVLSHNANFQQLISRGVVVSRDVDMKNGWRLVSIGSSPLFGALANLMLLFFNDELKQIHFALEQAGITDPDDIRKIHDSELLREFWTPQVQDAQKAMYVFPWGTLVSAYDPRGGQSEVVLSWQ